MGICRAKVACVLPCIHLADVGLVLVSKVCVLEDFYAMLSYWMR